MASIMAIVRGHSIGFVITEQMHLCSNHQWSFQSVLPMEPLKQIKCHQGRNLTTLEVWEYKIFEIKWREKPMVSN